MERSMEKVFITTILEENIKGNGNMIGNMGMGLYNMQTEINMKAIGKMGKEMVKVCMNTPMVIVMKANGLMI